MTKCDEKCVWFELWMKRFYCAKRKVFIKYGEDCKLHCTSWKEVNDGRNTM